MYAAHQLNLQPRVSLPETSPTLRWTGKVGNASAFRVWGSRAFVRDLSADKLPPRAVPCVFLGFPPDAPGWQFYHPTTRRVLSSQDVTFDKSVPYYCLFPYRTAPLPLPPLFLVQGPPRVDPLPRQGPAPSGVSQVDEVEAVKVAVDYGAIRAAEPAGAGFGGAESGGAEPGVLCLGVLSLGVLSLEVLRMGVLSQGVVSLRVRSVGALGLLVWPPTVLLRGGSHSLHRSCASGLPGAGGVRLELEVLLLLLVPEVLVLEVLELLGLGVLLGLLELVLLELLAVLELPVLLELVLLELLELELLGVLALVFLLALVRLRVLELALLELEVLLALVLPLESDSLRAASPSVTRLLATAVTDPSFESTTASALVAELVDFAARCRLDYAASLVAESESVCPPSVGDAPDIPTPRSYAEAIEGPYSSQWQSAMDAEMASWKSTGTYVDEVPPPGANIVSGMWIFRVKRPPGSPPVFKARYVARGFSQRQGVDYFQTFSPTPKMTTLRVLLHIVAQRDYELHSLDFSTAFLQGSLHEEIWPRRPPGFTGSFPPGTQWSLRRPVYGLRQAPREWHDTLRTTLAALGFAPSTADPSMFLRTDTSLPPFYILVYVNDLVFATADTARLAHSHMVQQVLQCFDFTYSSPQATPLSTRHSLSALPSDESVEPSGPYPELVGCLMYLMTCTRPDVAYPLSILARYVAPGRHRPEHMAAAKRVLRYLCSTSGMGLVLGGQRPVVLKGHGDSSWADDQAMQRSSQGYTFSLGSGSVSWRSTRSSSVLSSSCEAEIYAGTMAAQELRWLTYLLTDLEEPSRSPPVLYVDNKAMLALCREHRLEHRTKHIALRYFLARELQQRGQLRLAYVASEANTADIFTKALPPCDHQRFCTMLGLVPT
ncbi:unnamed protein product [Closterium sp. NIES-65]|nr:unnamed protein product [Closterium sp. NIES-65]